jgi:prepilin-type processing-associated H-X9-DG protein
MRQIGLAMVSYASNHQQQFPGDLTDLAKDPSAPPVQTYVCPDDTKSAPSGASIQQTITDLMSGNHCSYVYVGKGVQTSAPANTVLMYEDITLEHNGQINVLFVDGHVEKQPATSVQSAIPTAGSNTPMVLPTSGQ